MKIEQYEQMQRRTREFFAEAGIIITDKEEIEVADFGLDQVEKIGLQLVTYINTQRVCAKEMALFPGQTCPEHRHIPSKDREGKEETFRCRKGKVFLYVEGSGKAEEIRANMSDTDVTVFHEIVLEPGMQYTIMPNTLHWFQGGEHGAVISEFSTTSTDETDVFTDKRIVRATKINQ